MVRSLRTKHKEAVYWVEKRGHHLDKLAKSGKLSAAGAAATGLLLLSSGAASPSAPTTALAYKANETGPDKIAGRAEIYQDKGEELAKKLSGTVPDVIRPLTTDEENKIQTAIFDTLGVKAVAELDGKRLNTDFGLIGGEQHLYRYPGDSLDRHFNNLSERLRFYDAGIAPGLGAWGYFAYSKDSMTEQDVLREKYYVAVQTFLSEAWKTDPRGMSEWFKYRKVLVVNPKTGHGVVAVVGDSGPSTFTGKSFGGSPEVMDVLNLGEGPRKGEVILLFVDDPSNSIPLGPIDYQVNK